MVNIRVSTLRKLLRIALKKKETEDLHAKTALSHTSTPGSKLSAHWNQAAPANEPPVQGQPTEKEEAI